MPFVRAKSRSCCASARSVELGPARVVVESVHDGGPLHRPKLRVGLGRKERVELCVQALRRGNRRAAHVGGHSVVVIEDHRVDDVDPDAVRHRVLEHRQAARFQATRARRHRVLDLHRATRGGRPVLQDLDGLVAPVDAVGLGERTALDVHVQTRDSVRRDDGFVGGRDRVDVLTRVSDLGSSLVGAPPAERWDDVAPHRSEGRDVGEIGCRRDGLVPAAVPSKRARALAQGFQEREREVASAGSLGDRSRSSRSSTSRSTAHRHVRGAAPSLRSRHLIRWQLMRP